MPEFFVFSKNWESTVADKQDDRNFEIQTGKNVTGFPDSNQFVQKWAQDWWEKTGGISHKKYDGPYYIV